MAPHSLLTIHRVGHVYVSRAKQRVALSQVSATITAGERVALVGPAGCGKTSLLRIMAGYLQPSMGEVRFDGVLTTGPSLACSIVFPQLALYPWLNVAEHGRVGSRLRGAQHATQQIATTLDLLGLSEIGHLAPHTLPYALQQRVAIARALSNQPRLLLLDEPFARLDAWERVELQQVLQAIWQLSGITIIFTTENPDDALAFGTRVLELSPRPGRIIADYEPQAPALLLAS